MMQNAGLQTKIWIKALFHSTKTQSRESKIINPTTRGTQRQNPLSEGVPTLLMDLKKDQVYMLMEKMMKGI